MASETTSTEPLESTDDQVAATFASDVHDYVCQQIQFADQKAAVVFGVVTGLLAYLHANGLTWRWFGDAGGGPLAGVSVLFLVSGGIAALLVVLPRLSGSRGGLIFWRYVAQLSDGEDYAQRIIRASAGELVRERLRHCHELSRVCRAKYRILNVAVWLGSVGAALGLAYLSGLFGEMSG